MGKNDDVENIAGRERHHFLMQQMRERSSWQIHLERLKKELEVQENKWDHRDDERAEIERKRAEIRRLEEEAEREKSLERRQKISIVREEYHGEEVKMVQKKKKSRANNRIKAAELQFAPQFSEEEEKIRAVPASERHNQSSHKKAGINSQRITVDMSAGKASKSNQSDEDIKGVLSQHNDHNPQGESVVGDEEEELKE